MNSLNIKQEDKELFLIFNLLGLFYIIPLLLSNTFYWDDYKRSLSGDYGWEGDGRPLADLFVFLLTENIINLDIAPLPLLLSLPVLGIAAVIISKKLFTNETLLKKTILSTPILVNPLFLGNISFRFECWIMSLTQLFAVAAALLYRNNGIKGYIYRMVILVVLLSTYQASLNFYYALCFMVFIFSVMNNNSFKDALVSLLADASLMIVSFVLYKITVIPFVHFQNYASSHNSILKVDGDIFKKILSNTFTLFKLQWKLPTPYTISMAFLAIISIFSPIIKNTGFSKPNKGTILLAIIALIFLTPGLCLLLDNPVAADRIFLGFPALLMFLFYMGMSSSWKILGISMISLNLFTAVSTCYAYGNVLRQEADYRDVVSTAIINKLLENGYQSGDKVIVLGEERAAPANVPALASNRIFRTLIPRMLGDHDVWGYYVLAKQGLPLNFPSDAEIDAAKAKMDVLSPIYNDFRFYMYKTGAEFIVYVMREPRVS